MSAPQRVAHHLLDLFGDRGRDDRVADIGVDLNQEIPADDHRLGFRVVDVVGDDRATPRDLVADEFRRYVVRDRSAERLAIEGFLPVELLAPEVLADRDIFHLGGDDAAPCIRDLGHRSTRLGAQHLAPAAVEQRDRTLFTAPQAIILGLDLAALVELDIAARHDPWLAQLGQTLVDVDLRRRVGIETRSVVDADWRFARRGFEVDLAHRDRDFRVQPARCLDLARRGEGPGGDAQLLDPGGELGGWKWGGIRHSRSPLRQLNVDPGDSARREAAYA